VNQQPVGECEQLAVQSIYVITEEGETVQSLSLGNFKADETLLGGFMSAIQSFSKKVSGNTLEQLSTGDYLVLVTRKAGYLLVTVHDRDDSNPMTRHGMIRAEFKKHVKERASTNNSWLSSSAPHRCLLAGRSERVSGQRKCYDGEVCNKWQFKRIKRLDFLWQLRSCRCGHCAPIHLGTSERAST